jgi:hypothetical protein
MPTYPIAQSGEMFALGSPALIRFGRSVARSLINHLGYIWVIHNGCGYSIR